MLKVIRVRRQITNLWLIISLAFLVGWIMFSAHPALAAAVPHVEVLPIIQDDLTDRNNPHPNQILHIDIKNYESFPVVCPMIKIYTGIEIDGRVIGKYPIYILDLVLDAKQVLTGRDESEQLKSSLKQYPNWQIAKSRWEISELDCKQNLSATPTVPKVTDPTVIVPKVTAPTVIVPKVTAPTVTVPTVTVPPVIVQSPPIGETNDEVVLPQPPASPKMPIEPEMVLIPAGSYLMGSSTIEQEGPQHEVLVEEFWMGKYELTNAQYRMFNPSHDSESFLGYSLNADNQPAVNVSLRDAMRYAEWLTQQTGKQYRLPTEAEWEYAARGGVATMYYWGNDPEKTCEYANVFDQTASGSFWTIGGMFVFRHNCYDGFAAAAPVGQFKPNQFGLYDMLGNVWERTCSRLIPYNGAESTCVSKDYPDAVAIRGGSWGFSTDALRVTRRTFTSVGGYRYYLLGLRLVHK